MYRISTNVVLSLLVVSLVGCATSKEALMPHGNATMLDIWNQNSGGQTGSKQAARGLMEAREALRRPLTHAEVQADSSINAPYTRSAASEIYRQFRRLPNPDLVMFVFPHVAGSTPVPVPGYSTVFPLYERVQYAMPGERTEEY
jgi:conjugative transfer region lipoprotein (TIGR03751 family)